MLTQSLTYLYTILYVYISYTTYTKYARTLYQHVLYLCDSYVTYKVYMYTE